MRRNSQQLPADAAQQLLEEGTSGVLALLGDGDYPYAVPMSYVYLPPRLYFHSAAEGHKVDAVKKHGKASFCVIAQDEVQPASLTTHYRSVIAFGAIRLVEDEAEKRQALEKLALRYAPMHMDAARREMEESLSHMHLIALDVENITGKEARK